MQQLLGTDATTSDVIPPFVSNCSLFSKEANNEVGAVGPSGDFEIRDDRRNDLGRGVMPGEPDLVGNTVDAGSSAAQLPQKNILERKEVLIGRYLPMDLMFMMGFFFCTFLSCPNLSVLVPLGSQILDQQISLLPPAIFPCLLGAASLAAALVHVVQLHHDK